MEILFLSIPIETNDLNYFGFTLDLFLLSDTLVLAVGADIGVPDDNNERPLPTHFYPELRRANSPKSGFIID